MRLEDTLPHWVHPCNVNGTNCKRPQELRQFSMANKGKYKLGSGLDSAAAKAAVPDFPFVLSGYANHEEWLRATMGVPMAEWLYAHAEFVSHSGYFIVGRADILKYPSEMYARMRRQQTHASEEVDHFIERTWGMLFTARGEPPALSARQVPPKAAPPLPSHPPAPGSAHPASVHSPPAHAAHGHATVPAKASVAKEPVPSAGGEPPAARPAHAAAHHHAAKPKGFKAASR